MGGVLPGNKIITIAFMTRILLSILSKKRYWITAVIVFFVYVVIYLAATQFLIFTERGAEEMNGFFAVRIAENWQEIMFRQRAPFLFESIGAVYAGGMKLFISPLNMLLAGALGVLVALNFAVSYYNFRALTLRGPKGFMSLLGTVPAIVSGAVCCVPTLILVIGLQLTATFVAVWSFFVPLSFVLLIMALWWALYKIEKKKL